MERLPGFKSVLEGTRLIRSINYQRPIIAAIWSRAATGADSTSPAVTTGEDA
jgi:hypothetical protein